MKVFLRNPILLVTCLLAVTCSGCLFSSDREEVGQVEDVVYVVGTVVNSASGEPLSGVAVFAQVWSTLEETQKYEWKSTTDGSGNYAFALGWGGLPSTQTLHTFEKPGYSSVQVWLPQAAQRLSDSEYQLNLALTPLSRSGSFNR